MKRNILYLLIGIVFSFLNQEWSRAVSSDYETAIGASKQKSLPKTKVGASFILPLGPGEIALIQGYKAEGLSISLRSVRRLMPWTQEALGGIGRFAAEARRQFHMDPDYTKGLYQDYKPIYDAVVFAWKHGSQKGESIFIREAVSKFNMDPAYARTLYAQQRPDAEPETIIEEQEEASQTASSAAAQSSASPLKSSVTSGTTTASNSSSSKLAVLEEKEQEKRAQATGLDHEKDLSIRKVGASFVPPLGPGEIALIQGYKAEGLSIDLNRVRGLMSWTQEEVGGVREFVIEAGIRFNMDRDYAKGLYQDYKPIYEALRECYIRDDDQGEKLFIQQVVSVGKMTADYAKQFYSRFKPGQTLLEYWLEQKQKKSASQAASSAATQPNASPLKNTVTSGTTTASSSSSSSSQSVHEEKEQEDFVSSATWTSTFPKPFTGLRHRNISPPPD